jgi:hypothetical protein
MAYNSLRRFFTFAELWFASHCDSTIAIVVKGLLNRVFERIRPLSISLIEGTVNGDRITTLFFGNVPKAHQLANSIYSEITKISALGTTLSLHASRADLQHVDAIAIDARKHNIKKFLSLGYLILPNISFVLDLHKPADQICQAMSKRRRRDIRRISRQDFGYTVSTRRVQDFDFFYWKMCLPYAEERFGEAAMLSPYTILKSYYKANGGIIFLTKHTEPLAGILFQIRKDTIYALGYGVYDGNTDLVKKLAGTAALHLLIKWARSKGLKWLDYGKTVPFFEDGIFRYKKEWGMAIKPHQEQPYCVLKLNPHSKKAISLLQKNPFIIYDKVTLRGCVLYESRPKKELQNTWTRYYLPGLNAVMMLFYDRHIHTYNIMHFPAKEDSSQTPIKPKPIISQAITRADQLTHFS